MPPKTAMRTALYFAEAHRVALTSETLPAPKPGEVLVQTQFSAISPGTERLAYRGEIPPDLPLDETLGGLFGTFTFPFKYGYAVVGKIITLGDAVSPRWLGRQVFAFQPHQSHFCAPIESLLPLPAGLEPEDALFFPNVETALTLVLDGAPLLGERVAVVGQGVVGLLTTALLAQFPLAGLLTVDPLAPRRKQSQSLGATASFAPAEVPPDFWPQGADLIFELSGQPQALNQAINLAGYASRIVVGSWYGTKTAPLNLGTAFHRQRLQLISSQVSTLAPALRGRWDSARRLALVWKHLPQLKPSRLITHRLPFTQAEDAYVLLDQAPAVALQIIFTYQQTPSTTA